MFTFTRTSWLLSAFASHALALTFAIPSSPPSNSSPPLDPAPVGVSIEFFAFPAYMNDVPSTQQCLQNLKDVSGTWPPMRIGGTTQDRATYDASSTEAVTYTVADPSDAPESLAFGPSYIDLAGSYEGNVTIGFNRRLNNISNTIAASSLAYSRMANLYAIELGNEPNFFTTSDPIANNSPWTASADRASQLTWDSSLTSALHPRTPLLQAGVYFGTGSFSIAALAATLSTSPTTLSNIRSFASHLYPQSAGSYNLSALMSHSLIYTSQLAPFAPEIAAAAALEKAFVFGEANSATQGGGGVSPTFGAALWVLDYVLQSVVMGVARVYFHQGTIGNCAYCWWGRWDVGTPFYGAWFAARALRGGARVAMLDAGTGEVGVYAVYDARGALVRVVGFNSEYYEEGDRGSEVLVLTGLRGTSVSVRRLVGESATARVDRGGVVTAAGLRFENGTCAVLGEEVVETLEVMDGGVEVNVPASEAVLVDLDG